MTIQSASIYNVIKPNSLAREIPLLIAFNLLLVACSYISFNVPFSPVPITGQTFGILVVAMTLGRVKGTAVVLAYLLEGAVGLPVFAGGSAGFAKFMGPTGGYLLGFLVSAYLVGYLADIGWDRKYSLSLLAMTLGTAVILGCGLLWLSRFVPSGMLLSTGLTPFIPGAIVKIAIAFSILPIIWKKFSRK